MITKWMFSHYNQVKKENSSSTPVSLPQMSSPNVSPPLASRNHSSDFYHWRFLLSTLGLCMNRILHYAFLNTCVWLLSFQVVWVSLVTCCFTKFIFTSLILHWIKDQSLFIHSTPDGHVPVLGKLGIVLRLIKAETVGKSHPLPAMLHPSPQFPTELVGHCPLSLLIINPSSISNAFLALNMHNVSFLADKF